VFEYIQDDASWMDVDSPAEFDRGRQTLPILEQGHVLTLGIRIKPTVFTKKYLLEERLDFIDRIPTSLIRRIS
jgi:hypothetical protein